MRNHSIGIARFVGLSCNKWQGFKKCAVERALIGGGLEQYKRWRSIRRVSGAMPKQLNMFQSNVVIT